MYLREVLPLIVALLIAATAPVAAQDLSVGPDVTVIDLTDLANHGADGDYRGFSIGTDSCNIGTTPVNWCDNGGGCPGSGLDSDQHPVIAGNMYRLKGDRFEQIGKSWLKHGFFSLNTPTTSCEWNDNGKANSSCVQPPDGGNQLGVGCTDVYGSGLNGSRPLGMRSEVNASAGTFPFPETFVPSSGSVEQRVRVHQDDLAPPMNAGARYFVESHYVVDDDAAAGNGLNNASYREVTVDSGLNISFSGSTVREQSALHAWATIDPQVELAYADFVGDDGIVERFEVARKIVDNGGSYSTTVTVHNLNAGASGRSLTVTFPGRGAPAGISNLLFSDVDSHSGEFVTCTPGPTCAIDGTDWASDTSNPSAVTWSTDAYDAANPSANALRWGTSFAFGFDSTLDPSTATFSIGTYEPGNPSDVVVPFGATLIFSDGFESGNTSSWDSQLP